VIKCDFGWPLAVDTGASLVAAQLLEAVANAERERASSPGEAPLGEWEAWRVRPRYGGSLTSQALLENAEQARQLLEVRAGSKVALGSISTIGLGGGGGLDKVGKAPNRPFPSRREVSQVFVRGDGFEGEHLECSRDGMLLGATDEKHQ
jgi:hypothetical protein